MATSRPGPDVVLDDRPCGGGREPHRTAAGAGSGSRDQAASTGVGTDEAARRGAAGPRRQGGCTGARCLARRRAPTRSATGWTTDRRRPAARSACAAWSADGWPRSPPPDRTPAPRPRPGAPRSGDLGDDLSVAQHDDPVREPEHLLGVVAPITIVVPCSRRRVIRRSTWAESYAEGGRRLVEQQHRRPAAIALAIATTGADRRTASGPVVSRSGMPSPVDSRRAP